MEFIDRQAANPNRMLITPEEGAPFYAVLQRADNPIVEGTLLNAATFNALIDMIQSVAINATVE